MENTAILNYPGSKRRLINYIYNNSKDLIDDNKIILDIFSGTGCVAQFYKNQGFKVVTNDTEIYACHIANAILNGFDKTLFDIEDFKNNIRNNQNQLFDIFQSQLDMEKKLVTNADRKLIDFDSNLPKIFNLKHQFSINGIVINGIDDLNVHISEIPFCLFTLYYSGSYFGLLQSIEIDSIRYAIEKADKKIKSVLLTCLFYAMKEATFSKDGHMAQPLNHEKNFKKLISCRAKNITELFYKELSEFDFYITDDYHSEIRNQSFLELIEDELFLNNIGFIYADPPYTDMQYSRYFHLLTTISNYYYPELTLKNEKLTTGLYADNRFQSSISNRSKALNDLKKLIKKAAEHHIPLMFSYAYPIEPHNQPTNRYTMCVDDLIVAMKEEFSDVKVFKENFQHCNNRNSSSKKVFEYLIVGIPKKN